ncbi:hypothetical protein D1F52_10640 [Enterococcus faecalis]|nr:hypothetical protein [Enterococcus faecalis]EGO9034649.1 hypothetical protein [Enterococcus faecalis]
MMTIDEAKQLATYFSVGSAGYVLDFTNVTWNIFTKKIVGIEIQNHYGGSKGVSFQKFLLDDQFDDSLKNRLIQSLKGIMDRDKKYESTEMNPIVQLLFEEVFKEDTSTALRKMKFSSEIDLLYIRQLPIRIQTDIKNKDFDSVLTKANTLIDEVLKFIIENTEGPSVNINLFKSKELRKEAFGRLNIKTEKDMDNRIKALVGALNTLSDKILEMRNSQGDAHAHGSNRIVIKEEEAILVANSSMVLCEYLFTKYKGLNR